MAKYLSLYTPAPSNRGAPTPEHMAAMSALIGEMMAAGKLIATEPLSRRETGGFRISLEDGDYRVEENPEGDSVLLSASGYALIQADSKEELAANLRRFLEVAGDGTVEIIQIFDMPDPAFP